MSDNYITDALEAILEDITGFCMRVPMSMEYDSFFDEAQMDRFRDLVQREFNLSDNTLVDSCTTFRELVVLLQDELFG
jgi:hypothetical protein